MENLQRDIPVMDFLQQCLDLPTFESCCRTCPNYEKNWSCPPFSFSSETFWAQYDTLRLRCRVIPVPPELQKQTFTPQALNKLASELIWKDKRSMLEEMLLLEAQNPGSLALAAGSCDLCPPGSCSRPSEPCRHPHMMRYSVEALGGDVCKALKLYFGKEILWSRNGHLPPYYILLDGLLQKTVDNRKKSE